MNRNPNPMIPPNFVTLRMLKELKEKREEEERIKREEEERLRKIKEEEAQERIRRLKEEEEEFKKNRSKTLGSKKPYRPKFRRDSNPKAPPSGYGRPAADGGARVAHDRRPPRSANPDALMAGNGRSDLEERSPAAVESEAKRLARDELKKKKRSAEKARKRARKEAWKERTREMTKMPLGLNGVVTETVQVTAAVSRSGIIKVSGDEPCRRVKLVGSESGAIEEVEKLVSGLKMGERGPDPNRGRGRGWRRGGRGPSGFSGRGRGDGGMMWVKKSTDS